MPEDNIQYGSYVSTTLNMDVGQIFEVDVDSPKFKELIVSLYQGVSLMAMVLNTKTTGLYNPEEFSTGDLYYADPSLGSEAPMRPVYRRVVNFGALPNAGSKSVAHGITWIPGVTQTVRIYGSATNPTTNIGIPLDRSSPTLNENIKVEVSSTQVTVTTAINYSGFTKSTIVIEYIQS